MSDKIIKKDLNNMLVDAVRFMEATERIDIVSMLELGVEAKKRGIQIKFKDDLTTTLYNCIIEAYEKNRALVRLAGYQ